MLLSVVLHLVTAIAAGLATWYLCNRAARLHRAELEQRLDVVERSLATAGAGVFTADVVTRMTHCSAAALQLLGMRADRPDIPFAEWPRVIHEEDRAESMRIVSAAVASGERYVNDYRVIHPDGSTRWARIHGQPFRSGPNKVHSIYGVMLDITNIKHLEMEVRARDQRLRDVARAAEFHTWELDPETMVFVVDRPVQRGPDQIGVSSGNETVLHPLAYTLANMHPDDRAKMQAIVERTKEEDLSIEVEGRFMHFDGTLHWMITRGRVFRDAVTGARRYRGVIQDIHARKQAELQLQETEARLERAIRGTNDGLWEIDFASGKLWVSPRFAEILGRDRSELMQDSSVLFAITHPDDVDSARKTITDHVESGIPFDIELRQQTRAGQWRWYRVRGVGERDASGKPRTISGSQQDVTEKKQYQEALIEATATAAAANHAKSEFLANMSHEIRTPMNGVIGMTELLLETPLNAMQRDYAETVRDSAGALLTVINDILDFSKVEAGKLELEHLDIDPRDTLEDVARLLAIQAHAKGLEVTALIDPALPDMVKGDAGRLRQILLNLGGNAVKFTQHGEVALDLRVVSKDEHNVIVRCDVRDTGVGIPEHRLHALFQPFSQVDSSTTRKFGGTGLGLSIVRRLVELMGGQTGVTSQEGVGSTFWFTARLGISIEKNHLRPAPPAKLKGQRVLIVDDNATNRKVLMGQLTLCGIDPVCASSADEALALLRQASVARRPFEVAMLDHQMPHCDGARLGELIVADPHLKSTRMLLLTSSGQRGDGHRFAEIGFAGYLLKPVTQRDLTECLMLVLSTRAEAWHMQTQPIVTRHALRSQRGRGKHRILLAEDNVVNQKVACRTLEKLGFRVDVAGDGSAAVAGWETGRYALILMDCQMPVLDGYEATREIRRREAGGKHIPIVALTAHAMKGADEQCAAAGMDAYLAKPLDRALLESCLDRFLGTGTTLNQIVPHLLEAAAPGNEIPPVDWDGLLKATGGDESLVRELVALFIESGNSSVETIIQALENQDYALLGAKAHEIKGASANLQAVATSAAAERLEAAARLGAVDQMPELADDLCREVTRTIEYMRAQVA